MKSVDTNVVRVLKVDLDWVDRRVIELDKLIMDLADEFREAFTQSSETWHDNAMFDNVREKQNVLSAEQQNLWAIRKKVSIVKPPTGRKKSVEIGNFVILKNDKGKELKLLMGGDYISPDLTEQNGYRRISAISPIGAGLLSRKAGENVTVGSITYEVADITTT